MAHVFQELALSVTSPFYTATNVLSSWLANAMMSTTASPTMTAAWPIPDSGFTSGVSDPRRSRTITSR